MAIIMVGIGEMAISSKPGDVIKTMALGSCVGIMIFAPRLKAAGLAHVALPDSSIGNERRANLPAYFADLAVQKMVADFKKLGALRPADLRIKLAGGANIMDPNGSFNIGKRNVLAVKKTLWRFRMGAIAEDVGSNYGRTAWIEVDSGSVFLSSPMRGRWQI